MGLGQFHVFPSGVDGMDAQGGEQDDNDPHVFTGLFSSMLGLGGLFSQPEGGQLSSS